MTDGKTLFYSLIGAAFSGENRHASIVLKELGIEYDKWEPHPIADGIVLRGARNLPADMPDFIRIRQ